MTSQVKVDQIQANTSSQVTVNDALDVNETLNVDGVTTVTTVEVGHTSDTTLARSSAGNLSVEGNLIYRAGGTDVPVADGGTGSSTAAGARTALDVPSNSEAVLDTIMDAKGDLLTATAADTPARFAVGTDGQVLQANNIETAGLKWVSPTGPIGSGRNIAARTNAGAPTTTIDMTADELVVRNSTGGAILLTTVSESPIITGTGAGGLDTGAEAGNTWYYGWIIYNPTTADVAGLISASSSAPTMPSGYTYKALVTAMRNNGSSNFVAYRQFGNEVFYELGQAIVSGSTAVVETAVSLATNIPPIAQSARIYCDTFSFTAAGDGNAYALVDIRFISGSGFTLIAKVGVNATALASHQTGGGFTIVPNVSQQIYFLTTITNGSSPSLTLGLTGFKLPVGGE